MREWTAEGLFGVLRMKCDKCGIGAMDEWCHGRVSPCLMVGVYYTTLCDDCRNDWAKFMEQSDVRQQDNQLSARRDWLEHGAYGVDNVSLNDWQSLSDEESQLKTDYHNVAAAWVAQKTKSREEPADGQA